MTKSLGTVQIADISHSYAPGSFLATARFEMDGLTFIARRFKRTDSFKVDNFELYIAHESTWLEDFVKFIDPHSDNLSRVDRRALHLLAVACSVVHDDVAARFAQIELN